MLTTLEILMGYGEKRERECIKPRAGDADLRIKIWEELHSLAARDMAVEVEHVKAYCTMKEQKERCRTLKILSPKASRRRMI